jgi:hypothetical protein
MHQNVIRDDNEKSGPAMDMEVTVSLGFTVFTTPLQLV